MNVNRGTRCVEVTVNRRSVYLPLLCLSLHVLFFWPVELHWCMLFKVEWPDRLEVAQGFWGHMHMERRCALPLCKHMNMSMYVCLYMCVWVSRWSEGLCCLNWLMHHATSSLLQRSAISTTHRPLLFGVLYLNKLVSGLKNVHHKWCEEECWMFSYRLQFVPLSWPQYCRIWDFNQQKKKSFNLSFSRPVAPVQTPPWTKPSG